MPSPVTVFHAVKEARFESPAQGSVAVLEYALAGEVMTIHHTYVPEALRGMGLAAALAKAAFDYARSEGLRVDPACSYIARYAERHPEAKELI